MTRRRTGRQTPAATLAMPALIASATCIGLLAGLAGDGMWDLVAAAGLAIPVAAWLRHDPPGGGGRNRHRGRFLERARAIRRRRTEAGSTSLPTT